MLLMATTPTSRSTNPSQLRPVKSVPSDREGRRLTFIEQLPSPTPTSAGFAAHFALLTASAALAGSESQYGPINSMPSSSHDWRFTGPECVWVADRRIFSGLIPDMLAILVRISESSWLVRIPTSKSTIAISSSPSVT